jgi:hypothetical protein
MRMNYWLDLFTGTTWHEFQAAGGRVTGFREHNWKRASGIRPGDIFLSYLVGVKRWVGLLEVTGNRYRDDSPVWGEEVFPVRFPVQPLVILPAEHGIPMSEFRGKLSFYASDDSTSKWSGWVRSSPTKYRQGDGDTIAKAIRLAESNPVTRPVDPRQLTRSSNLYKLKAQPGEERVEAVVSVPTDDDNGFDESPTLSGEVTHTEIQWRLLDLGAQMGLRVWAPKSDRGRIWDNKKIGDVPGMLDSLPVQFGPAANKTIESIDVLWLSGQADQAIDAAFEVEHTTSVYSGLLRLSDLLTLQPNLKVKFYLVGPDDRLSKFKREIARPTFSTRKTPLHSLCRFLPYSALCKQLEEARNLVQFLRPEFLDEIAEGYDPADELDA